MEQTAVEWLLFELSKNGLLPDGISSDIHNQAKEMEKEQRSQANNGNYCAVCGGTEFWYDEELDSSIIEDDDEYDDDDDDDE
jgi:hypothetical protein